MENETIKVITWCESYQVDYNFVDELESRGLITLVMIEEEKWVHHDQLSDLEQFTRWHYDMDINLEGIETIAHLLGKIKSMQNEVALLKTRLGLYE
jgi:hypothetical protein